MAPDSCRARLRCLLLAMATAMVWGWACALPATAHPAAAPSLSPAACTLQPDELAFEWCDLLRQAESACAAVEPAHRAHCLDCWLANHRVRCAPSEATPLHVAAASLWVCAAAPKAATTPPA